MVGLELVAEAADVFHHMGVVAQFFAQIADVDVDGAFQHNLVVAPKMVEDLAALENPARPAGEQLQDLEFREG